MIEYSAVTASCNNCICSSCMLHWSARCPYGSCYDDLRAKETPFDEAHPNRPPRTGWSRWKEEQAFWCRGGLFYPVDQCKEYVLCQNPKVQDCLMSNLGVCGVEFAQFVLAGSVGAEQKREQW